MDLANNGHDWPNEMNYLTSRCRECCGAWLKGNRILVEISSVGPTTATAFVAAIGGGESFGKGGDLPAWRGLVSRQSKTSGKAKRIGISKVT